MNLFYKLAVNLSYYSYELFKFLSVFMYVVIPVDVCDFWQQPLDVYDFWQQPLDVVNFEYLFPRQGWVCRGLYWLYSLFVYCMNIVTQILANVSNLQYIANIELYR